MKYLRPDRRSGRLFLFLLLSSMLALAAQAATVRLVRPAPAAELTQSGQRGGDEPFAYPALPFTFRWGIRITLGGESWKLK